jgi:hypothetical protein
MICVDLRSTVPAERLLGLRSCQACAGSAIDQGNAMPSGQPCFSRLDPRSNRKRRRSVSISNAGGGLDDHG